MWYCLVGNANNLMMLMWARNWTSNHKMVHGGLLNLWIYFHIMLLIHTWMLDYNIVIRPKLMRPKKFQYAFFLGVFQWIALVSSEFNSKGPLPTSMNNYGLGDNKMKMKRLSPLLLVVALQGCIWTHGNHPWATFPNVGPFPSMP